MDHAPQNAAASSRTASFLGRQRQLLTTSTTWRDASRVFQATATVPLDVPRGPTPARTSGTPRGRGRSAVVPQGRASPSPASTGPRAAHHGSTAAKNRCTSAAVETTPPAAHVHHAAGSSPMSTARPVTTLYATAPDDRAGTCDPRTMPGSKLVRDSPSGSRSREARSAEKSTGRLGDHPEEDVVRARVREPPVGAARATSRQGELDELRRLPAPVSISFDARSQRNRATPTCG